MSRNTTDFIFELTKDIPKHQMADSDAMNTTAGTIFGAASIVLGLAVAGGADLNQAATALMLSALLPYTLVIIATFVIISGHKFHDVVDPKWLWDECKDDDVSDVTRMLAEAIPKRVETNQDLLHTKVVAFRWALLALGLETALVVIAVVVSYA